MLRQLLLICLFLVVSACGSDSPSGPDDQGGPTSTLTCSEPALAATEAEPLARVEISGVTGINDDTWVEYETASGTRGLTAILPKEGGGFEIIVPAHPDQLMAGGILTLTVTDGETRCASLSIDVLPTEPAEGDPLADAMTVMGDLSDAFVAQFGLDATTLRATTLDALPPHAVPVALLLETCDAMDSATVLASLSADEAAFVQAMIERSGIIAALEDALSSTVALGVGAANRAKSSVAARRTEGCTDLGVVPNDIFDLSGPAELSETMKAARGAGDPNGPLNQAIGTVSSIFAVMGLAAPNVGLVAGYATFAAQLIQKIRAGLYPSSISRLEYQIDRDRIEEDWDKAKGDPDTKWNFAKLWATNDGMGLARVGIDLVSTGVPLPGPFGNNVADGIFDIVGKDKINKRLDELEKDPDRKAECWGIGMTEFGPVVVPDDSGEEWVRTEVTGGDAISIEGPQKRTVRPQNIGTATLRVRTQPDPFPGPFGFEDKPVEVLRKEVVWLPRKLIVKNPGEEVTVKFRVDNAKHNESDDVEVTPGPYLPELTPTFSGGVHTITFKTPTEKEAYPTYIDARSTSKELPPNLPVREGQIQIVTEEWVEIAKKNPCVGSGQPETFTAEAGGPENPLVMWEVYSGAGEVSPMTGLSTTYTAPTSGSGQVTLRAYLSTNNEVEDFVTFSYGVCGGLAAWWGHTGYIGFPFSFGEPCNNPDLDASGEEITFTEDAFEPGVRPASADLFINRTQTFNKVISDTGTFGDVPPGSQTCSFDVFSAEASYDGSLVGSADGTRLDVDFNVSATSVARAMGELGTESSSAGAAMTLGARFDFDITEATNYRLQVQLDSEIPIAQFGLPFSGMLSLIPAQIRPDGSFAPVNSTTQPIQIQAVTGVPIIIDRVMEFGAPASGQTDHVLVIIQMGVSAAGATPEDNGEVNQTGFIKGFFSVVPQ